MAHIKDGALLSLRLLGVEVCCGDAAALQTDKSFHLQQSTAVCEKSNMGRAFLCKHTIRSFNGAIERAWGKNAT